MATPEVTILAATSIFMIIIAFFICKHIQQKWLIKLTEQTVMRCASVTSTDPEVLLRYATCGSLRHYCSLFSLYFGLRQECESSLTPDHDERLPDPNAQVWNDIIHNASEDGSSQDLSGWQDWSQNFGVQNWMGSDLDLSPPEIVTPGNMTASSGYSDQYPDFTPATTSTQSSPSAGLSGRRSRCLHCKKIFSSKSNLGKHIRSDCRMGSKQRFPCKNPGCVKELTREAYRIVHEREKCAYR